MCCGSEVVGAAAKSCREWTQLDPRHAPPLQMKLTQGEAKVNS